MFDQTVGSPSMKTHHKLGGWKVNSVGRHSDHNRERISSAVSAINTDRANSASAPQLRPLSPPIELGYALKVDVTADTIGADTSTGAPLDSINGLDCGPRTPPIVVNLTGMGFRADDSSISHKSLAHLHNYERSSSISHASTDVDALKKEFVDHLSNSLVDGQGQDLPTYVVPGGAAGSVGDSPLSSCRDTSFEVQKGTRNSTLVASVTNITASDNSEPYMVHSRIMGWKLTSLSRRKKLMSMLDKIQEIPTDDMIELSYSHSEAMLAPAEKSSSSSGALKLNDSAMSGTDPNPKEITPGGEAGTGPGIGMVAGTKSDINDSFYQNDYATSSVLNTYSRIWNDPETKTATLRAATSRSKSKREVDAWEASVARQLKAFESTPTGKAEKIRRLTELARKPARGSTVDGMSAGREKQLTQKLVLKKRDESIDKVRRMHAPSELHLNLLRERDRMDILQAASAITGNLTSRIAAPSIYDGDSTIQQMLEARWQQQQNAAYGSVSNPVHLPVLAAREDVSVVMPARSQLYQALARPPPQSAGLTATFSSDFSSTPSTANAQGFPSNDELDIYPTDTAPSTGAMESGMYTAGTNPNPPPNPNNPTFTDTCNTRTETGTSTEPDSGLGDVSKDMSNFFSASENGRDFNSLATSNEDMGVGELDGMDPNVKGNGNVLEMMQFNPSPIDASLAQRHDNWFRVVKSEPYLVASNNKMQKSLSLPPV